MLQHLRWFALLLVAGAAPIHEEAAAEQVRYHYVPIDACGAMTPAPIGPEGSMGELKRVFGARALPYPYVVRPTQMVTFRHSNGRNVTVPLRLPESTPRMEHRADRIIYNYNDYVVEVRFLPDGSVDVVYNSGLLRPLPFN
jgi:hypothetical protein